MLVEFTIMNEKDVILRLQYRNIDNGIYYTPDSLRKFQNYLESTHNKITHFFKVSNYAYAFQKVGKNYLFYLIYDFKDFREFDGLGLENNLRIKLQDIVKTFQEEQKEGNSYHIRNFTKIKTKINEIFSIA